MVGDIFIAINFNFNLKKIQEVEEEFRKVEMNPRIKEVAEGVAILISNLFKIPINAAKGVAWLTIKNGRRRHMQYFRISLI